jgi:hypothetical protein
MYDSPFVLFLLRIGELLGLGVDSACELVVTTAVHINIISVVACVRAALARAVAVAVSIIAIDVLAFLVDLSFLPFLGAVFKMKEASL